MIVGYPSILYLSASTWFCFFCASLSFFLCGKSTSTGTKFALAYSANSGVEKTSLFSLMHQPHQSEPVKSSITSFFSVLALACAAAASVIQWTSPALTVETTQEASNAAMVAFMCVVGWSGYAAGGWTGKRAF